MKTFVTEVLTREQRQRRLIRKTQQLALGALLAQAKSEPELRALLAKIKAERKC